MDLEEDRLDREKDHALVSSLSKEKLVDLLFMHIRNVFRVDGLYFLGIEKKFGTDVATGIDKSCWKKMAAIEAREIGRFLGRSLFPIPDIMEALQLTSWSLDQGHKEVEVNQAKAVFRVVSCDTQLTRRRKGLPEFPCKQVRFEYLKAFVQELNPQVDVLCHVCPPDRHSEEIWCEWEFRSKQ